MQEVQAHVERRAREHKAHDQLQARTQVCMNVHASCVKAPASASNSMQKGKGKGDTGDEAIADF